MVFRGRMEEKYRGSEREMWKKGRSGRERRDGVESGRGRGREEKKGRRKERDEKERTQGSSPHVIYVCGAARPR